MESLNVKNINDEKIFNVIDPNGQGEVVNRIRPISISINQKAQTINDQTDSTINLAVYWNDTWKSILDLTFDESLRQEYGKLVEDLTTIQKDIDMKQYKDAETKTADFLKYVANLSSKYTAIPEKAVVSRTKNDFVKIKADKNSVKVAISDKLLNFMLKKYAKVDNLDYTKSNECFSTSKFNCLANNYDIYYHSPEIFQKQAYMTVVKDNKVVGSYKVNYDQFSKFASKFMLTPQKLGYSKDKMAGYMKTAEVVMQNIFFDSVDEAKEWQEMVDEKKKEQATSPEGEEETTEIKEIKTKTEIGEGKSESPVKEDGGLARSDEDFASDEIPESEPKQQEQQQGGGQNLGASRRINLLKKKALKYPVGTELELKDGRYAIVKGRTYGAGGVETEEYVTVVIPEENDHEEEISTEDIKNVVDIASKRKVKNVKKTAKVGYNAEPENELEEKVIEIGDEIMGIDGKYSNQIVDLAFDSQDNPNKKEENDKKITDLKDKLKREIKVVIDKNKADFTNKEFYDLFYEHLQDNNFHTANKIIEEILNGKQSNKKIKLNKKADKEYVVTDEWQEKNSKGVLVTQKMEEKLSAEELIDFAKERWDPDYEDEEITDLDSAIKWLEENGFKVSKQASKKVKLNKKAGVGAGYKLTISGLEVDPNSIEITNEYAKDENSFFIEFKAKLLPKEVDVQAEHSYWGVSDTLPIVEGEISGDWQGYNDEETKEDFYDELKNATFEISDIRQGGYIWHYETENFNLGGEMVNRGKGAVKEYIGGDGNIEIDWVFIKSIYIADAINDAHDSTFEDEEEIEEEIDIENNKKINVEKQANKNLKLNKKAGVDITVSTGNVYTLLGMLGKYCLIQPKIIDGKNSNKPSFKLECKPAEVKETIEKWKDPGYMYEKTATEKQAKEYKRYNVIVKFNDKEEEYEFENDNEFLALDEALGYFGEKWHELPLANEIEKLEEVKVQELGVDDKVLNEYTKEYFIKNKDKFPKYSCNKKALYGDVQEQDIVPAKTETKVYLQSEKVEDFVWLINSSGRIEILAPKALVMGATGSGDNSEGVEELRDYIKKDLEKISVEEMQKTVSEYGVDNVKEMDKDELERYLVWLLAGDTADNIENRLADKEDLENIKANTNSNVQKKAEEQMVEEKKEEQVADDTVKGKIGVGDIVAINFDNVISSEDFPKYEEFIGKPLILMENDKEDITKVIVEQTEYPFQRITVDNKDVVMYEGVKGEDVIVEDVDGDEMITTFEELPVVAKQCKIKSIHKAARINKKKANLTKKAINSLEDVAGLIDTIWSDYDWYEYADALEVGEASHYENILADLQKDEKGTIEGILKLIEEDDNGYTAPEIEQLKEYYNAKFGGK